MYDGESEDSPEIMRTCGSEGLPNNITSTSNVLRVRMKADGRSSTAKGFKAKYAIVSLEIISVFSVYPRMKIFFTQLCIMTSDFDIVDALRKLLL